MQNRILLHCLTYFGVLKEPTRLTRCDTSCYVSDFRSSLLALPNSLRGSQVFVQRNFYSSVIMTEPRSLPMIKISLLSSTYLLAHFLTDCMGFWFQCPLPAINKGAQGFFGPTPSSLPRACGYPFPAAFFTL